jgi:hypothetical protein
MNDDRIDLVVPNQLSKPANRKTHLVASRDNCIEGLPLNEGLGRRSSACGEKQELPRDYGDGLT